MTTQTIGTLRREGEQRAVRHVRHYDATPEEVWAALTDPEQVKNWRAAMTIEPRAGGRVAFEWEGGHTDEGEVRVFDPPRTFEYTWEKRAPSVVRIELSPEGNGTQLVLDHSRIDVGAATSIAAGWHMHLDALESLLAGSPQTPAEWNPRHEGLVGLYEEHAKAL
jgi:uncharacterized protein YndB with AHSA1/START domain